MEAVLGILLTFFGSWVLLIALPIISKTLDTFINYDVIKINKQSIEGSECTWPFSLTYSGFSPVIDAGPPS